MREIPPEQVLERVKTENPWWKTRQVERSFRDWKPRPYLRLFLDLVEETSVRRAIVLMGPRRVGKTVLLHHTIQVLLDEGVDPRRIGYFSVDHPIYNGLSLDELVAFFLRAAEADESDDLSYLVFDEIQYLKDWERHLKVLVDDHPRLRFIASGSAAAALHLKSRESGAGRFTDFFLPPLTFYEYLELLGRRDLVRMRPMPDNFPFDSPDFDELNLEFIEYLNFGGYPEMISTPEIRRDPSRFIKADIIDKVLLRDLPSLYGIQDIQELNSLFTTLAFNTADEVSLEGLSKRSGVAKPTIKRYIEYLEAAFLIRVVHRVDRSAKRFKRANFFKVYLTNPSMRAALFSPINADDTAIGSLVETAAFSQWFHSESTPLFYARWQSGEVDLVHLDPRQKPDWVVEVKWADRAERMASELSKLLSFCRANNLPRATVTTRTKRSVQTRENVELTFVPASLYCHSVGARIISGKLWEASPQPSLFES